MTRHHVSARMLFSLLIGAGVPIAGAGAQSSSPAFSSIFGDHAVLQRDRPVEITGTAAAGEAITLTLAGQTIAVTADNGGRWSALLRPITAGGPYRMTVTGRGGGSATIDDVMFGDVFLCSGQSNMEMRTKHTTGFFGVGLAPADPNIRFATIAHASNVVAQTSLADRLSWQIAAPDTVGESFAVCYFMARDLQKAKNVAIGLVQSSVGGTAVQAWMSAGALGALSPYADRLVALQAHAASPTKGQALWAAHVEQWWAQLPQAKGAAGWRRAEFDDTAWDRVGVPGQSGDAAGARRPWFSGAVWYRHAAMLDRAQARGTTALDLGIVPADATVWLNGRLLGSRIEREARAYPVPAGLLKAGRNVIAVRLLDHGNDGTAKLCARTCGLASEDGGMLPLGPEWRYRVIAPMADLALAPRAPWQFFQGLATLYNAMIRPLTDYRFKAVIWYQGESNVSDPTEYKRLLPLFVADWRRAFADPELPFAIVQLAGFGAPAAEPLRSGWAEVREVQRQVALTQPKTALVVTLDLGDRTDIHPSQKKVVGQRVARALLSVAYGDTKSPGAPKPLTAVQSGEDVVIDFSDTDGGLKTYSSDRAIGFETCDAHARCQFAVATADGNQVIIAGAARKGAHLVRYAWANSPFVNLFGGSDIPAVPFEILIGAAPE